jgi:hypothetical protein
MKQPNNNTNKVMKRELKIEDITKQNKDFREVDEYLKSVSKKFMKEPISIESLDKVYNDMVGKNKTDKSDKME